MSILRSILRKFGYLKFDYGFSFGRHWVQIDGKVVAQTSGYDCWMRDEDVHRLGYICLDHGKFWTKPETPHAEIIREALNTSGRAGR